MFTINAISSNHSVVRAAFIVEGPPVRAVQLPVEFPGRRVRSAAVKLECEEEDGTAVLGLLLWVSNRDQSVCEHGLQHTLCFQPLNSVRVLQTVSTIKKRGSCGEANHKPPNTCPPNPAIGKQRSVINILTVSINAAISVICKPENVPLLYF